MDVASRAVMMAVPAHHSITPASVTGRPPQDLSKAPLTGRAALRAGATKRGGEVALQIRGVDPGE
jgi:hypothetical protein